MSNPTLLEECKALVSGNAYYTREGSLWQSGLSAALEKLKEIISRHEHDYWKGPWKCETCGSVLPFTVAGHGCNSVGADRISCCTGRLVPFERRKAERRQA